MNLWWRDDDAGPDDARLDRLLALAERWQVPVVLAVVPAWLHPATVRRILACPLATVAQHGYAHVNHGAADGRKCELAARRDAATLDKELGHGAQVLEQGFGSRFYPVMVPPWNRIEAAVSHRLSRLGYVGLSTFRRSRPSPSATGLIERDADLDLIRWKEGRRPMSADEIVSGVDLAGRPLTGLLTHHAVTDDAGFAALDEALGRLATRPGTRFLGMDELFGGDR